jgi:hypothetical protein
MQEIPCVLDEKMCCTVVENGEKGEKGQRGRKGMLGPMGLPGQLIAGHAEICPKLTKYFRAQGSCRATRLYR